MKLHVTTASATPFYRQVFDQLADQIRSGELRPGAPLPSVRQLASELLVSVITITKAYDELAAAGLTASMQGKGTFVAQRAPTPRAELRASARADLRETLARAGRLGLSREEIAAIFEEELAEAALESAKQEQA